MYKLVLDSDPNESSQLDSLNFNDAVEEALDALNWYVIDEGECLVAVNNTDANDTFALTEPEYEDAQYEAITTLGYYILQDE
jgi:hypothetical protein